MRNIVDKPNRRNTLVINMVTVLAIVVNLLDNGKPIWWQLHNNPKHQHQALREKLTNRRNQKDDGLGGHRIKTARIKVNQIVVVAQNVEDVAGIKRIITIIKLIPTIKKIARES